MSDQDQGQREAREELEEENGPFARLRALGRDLINPIRARFRLDRAWPLLALSAAALLSLIPFDFHAGYFVAMAQVIPVLLVAVFVEMSAMHRIYVPVVAETFDTPPEPYRAAFYDFKIWVRAMLRLALIGLTAALIALASNSQSAFLGWLSAISAGGIALSLATAFTQRLEFYQLLQRRTPGGPPQV